MTENEAINDLDFFIDKLHNGIFGHKMQCFRVAIAALEEIKEYRAIGTAKECRKAVERQRAKKPNVWGDGYDDKGGIIYDMYDCPNCGEWYEIDYDNYKYCPECGQAIDWGDDQE